jgi:Nitrile hydratase, alpha chain
MNGAKVVARVWVDAEYKARLLTNCTATLAELAEHVTDDSVIDVAGL